MNRLNALIILTAYLTVHAQEPLSLDSCRRLAIAHNQELKIARESRTAAHYEHLAARTNYLPKLSVTGTYMYNSKELSLLNNRQKETLNNIGTHLQDAAQDFWEGVAQASPTLAALAGQLPIESFLNEAGRSLTEALRTDTRHIWAGSIAVTQPVYMGGKIKAYDQITRQAEQLAKWQEELVMQELIAKTEEAYWRVVSLTNKKGLAESYLNLTKTLDKNVERLIGEGMATQADGLSVKVKTNEAEMAWAEVCDGLNLSRMSLALLCGMDLEQPLHLTDEQLEHTETMTDSLQPDIDTALALRPELKSLESVCDIYRQNINVVRADFLPTVALTGGYLTSNPSLYNGFEKKFNGAWNIGLIVNIPLFRWGEGTYKVRAAKAEADMRRHELDEARKEITLQVTQATYRVNESYKRLALAERNQERADENLRYANLGFQEGVIPAVQVMEAQTAWLAAHSARIDALINLRLNETYLNKALGITETGSKE